MAISKFTVDGVTQIDLTQDTVAPNNLTINETAIAANGELITGQAQKDNENALLEKTISGTYINNNVTAVRSYAFERQTNITKVVLPNVTTLGANAFLGCTNLEEVNLPNVATIGSYAFSSDSALTEFIGPKVKTFQPTNQYSRAFLNCINLKKVSLPVYTKTGSGTILRQIFKGCKSLTTVELPNTTAITASELFSGCTSLESLVLPSWGKGNLSTESNFGTSYFSGCTKLKYVDTLTPCKIDATCFSGCTVFSTLILRGNRVTALVNISAFNNSPFASTGSGGTLYVPAAQVSSYESATNWSTILGYENNQILPIEESEYEFFYADGTPINA